MMDPQAWATLEALLGTCQATLSEQTPLGKFYEACSRKPLKCNRRPMPLPLKTLLLHHAHLRPDIKAGLEAFLCEQWRWFNSENPPPPPPDTEEVATPVAHPTREDAPPEDQRERPSMPEDWFDRLLNGIRILLFL